MTLSLRGWQGDSGATSATRRTHTNTSTVLIQNHLGFCEVSAPFS